MFSQELDNLIDACLVDGKLDDLEKQALVERAEKEGVSQTELLVYINSILQKRAQTKNEEEEARENARFENSQKEKGKLCPHCHAPLPPLAETCPECGAVIMTAAVNDKIERMMSEVKNKLSAGISYQMIQWGDRDKALGILQEAKQKNLELKMLFSSVQKVAIFCSQTDIDIESAIESTKAKKTMMEKSVRLVGIIVIFWFLIIIISFLLFPEEATGHSGS